jgi:hypothetical protein
MLAKQIKGRDFHGCLSYVLGKSGAVKIGGNMLGQEVSALHTQFIDCAQKRPQLQRTVYHCALSLAPHETLSDATWRQVTKNYLEAMGFTLNQYVLVRHTDTEHHQHVHIIANRVKLDGDVVSESFDHYRAQSVVRALEETYHLQAVQPSWRSKRKALSLRQLKKEAETGIPSVQRHLQDEIAASIQTSRSLTELVQRLQHKQIQTYAFYGHRNRLQGIAYETSGVTMSGTALGYRYQIGGLQEQLAQGATIALHPPDQIEQQRRNLIASIRGAAFDRPRLSVLVERLEDEGVAAHIQFARVGRYGKRAKRISYCAGDICFQASDLGTVYTLSGLQRSLGVQYEPEHDDPLIQARQHQLSEPITPAPSVPESHICRVHFTGVVTSWDEDLRDRLLQSLTEAAYQVAEYAHSQDYDQVEFVADLTPGVQQWSMIAALWLKELQQTGKTPSKPAITVTGITQENHLAWDEANQQQIFALSQAVDRVEHPANKHDSSDVTIVIDSGYSPHSLSPSQHLIWINAITGECWYSNALSTPEQQPEAEVEIEIE